MIRIKRVKRAKDGSCVVEIGVLEPQFQGILTVLVGREEDVEETITKEVLKLRERELEFTDDLELVGRTYEIRAKRLERTTEPTEEELSRNPWMCTFQEGVPQPLAPSPYVYEFYTDMLEHKKLRSPIALGSEVYHFEEELTPDEIRELEKKTGKKVRKVA